ncbi:hypothetical protein SK128_016592, partial [Halocaridina rubra]
LLPAPKITVPAEPHITASPAGFPISTATSTVPTISNATPTASTISTEASTAPATSTMSPTVLISQEPLAQSPPRLQADTTYQGFGEWCLH